MIGEPTLNQVNKRAIDISRTARIAGPTDIPALNAEIVGPTYIPTLNDEIAEAARAARDAQRAWENIAEVDGKWDDEEYDALQEAVAVTLLTLDALLARQDADTKPRKIPCYEVIP